MPSRAAGSRRRRTRLTRLQTNIMLQQVTAEQVKVQQVEKEGQIKVQEAEILRHEKELIATMLKGAEMERQRIENTGCRREEPAGRRGRGPRRSHSHPGRSGSLHHLPEGRGGSQGHARESRGVPGVEPGRGGGRLMSSLPEVVRAMAEPLSKVDKITIVSTGNDDAAGAHKITGDMTQIAAQVPALFEALSGMDIKQLMSNVTGDQDQTEAR